MPRGNSLIRREACRTWWRHGEHRPKPMTTAAPAVDSSRLTTDDYLELPLGDLLDRLSADGLAPGGGSAAALTVAFAARLVAMVARCSPAWSDAAGVVAQANAIGERAVELAHTDGRVWDEALTALRDAEAAESDDPTKGLRAGAEARGRGRGAARDRLARGGHGPARGARGRARRADVSRGRRGRGSARGRRRVSRRASRPRESRGPQRRSAARRARSQARTPRTRSRPACVSHTGEPLRERLRRRARPRHAERATRRRGTSSSSATRATSTRSRSRGFRLSDEDAEDVFQDVFTRIYTRLDSLRDDSALRPWIAQLTRRRCLDAIAARREVPAEELDEEGSTDLERRRGGVRGSRGARRALGELPGHPRPLLHARSELQDDRRRARDPVRNDREPHRALPRLDCVSDSKEETRATEGSRE